MVDWRTPRHTVTPPRLWGRSQLSLAPSDSQPLEGNRFLPWACPRDTAGQEDQSVCLLSLQCPCHTDDPLFIFPNQMGASSPVPASLEHPQPL